MSEYEPLQINTRALFAAIDGKIRAGGNIGDLFEDPIQSSERLIRDKIEEGMIKMLDLQLLRGRMSYELDTLDKMQTAIDFKNETESWRKGILTNPSANLERKIIAESTTMEDLARVAEAEHEKWVNLSAMEDANAIEHEALQNEADRWEFVTKIVRLASEIRD